MLDEVLVVPCIQDNDAVSVAVGSSFERSGKCYVNKLFIWGPWR
jgi:hypothetical protein